MSSVKDTGSARVKALAKALASIGQYQVTVGVHAEDGGATYDGGATVSDIATFHEFGTATIPARSFVRAWADGARAEIQSDLQGLAEAIVAGKVANPETGLRALAARWVGQVQDRISDGIPPPLAESTIARKGSATALIDTGQLRSSIRARVRRKGR